MREEHQLAQSFRPLDIRFGRWLLIATQAVLAAGVWAGVAMLAIDIAAIAHGC